jgi:hypothetical protein
MATGTADPQEPVLQAAALQVVLKFPPDEPRKGPSFCLELCNEIRVVVVNDSIEKRFFRSMSRMLQTARHPEFSMIG